jgi:phenylalanyl-tRNA synthetase beta chain
MKGLLEALAARLGVGLDLGANGGERPAFLHPGKSALVRLNGAIVGAYGALHPDTIAAWELREDAVVAELELDALLTVNVVPVRVESLPRSPAVTRDLSILLDASVTAAAIEVLVRSASGPLLREMAFRDRYDRPPVPTGKVSLTVSLRFQDPARTLTGAEVEGAVERVVAALRASGAEIRGA